jgi:putative transposase
MENVRIFHIINRSIADYTIFRDTADYSRFIEAFQFFLKKDRMIGFSNFMRLDETKKDALLQETPHINFVKIIAYAIMPNHFHIIVEELIKNGVSEYTRHLLNSYTRYFNTKNKRKGPLWQARTKRIAVENDEYLLYLTRYIHRNPVKAKLVEHASDWPFTSYREYISKEEKKICDFTEWLLIDPEDYACFVNETD